jgi:hypothetical protein
MKQLNLERFFSALEKEENDKAAKHPFRSLSYQYHDGKADAYKDLAILASQGRIPTDMQQTELAISTVNEHQQN